jgi:uncharacterized protein involved in outer membrane biogenesis
VRRERPIGQDAHTGDEVAMRRTVAWLAALVVLLGAVVVVVEVTAPGLAARRMEAAVAESTDGRLTVDAAVSGPPLVVPGVLTGRIEEVRFDLASIAGFDVPIEVGVVGRGVTIDRATLLRGRVAIEDVETVTAGVRVEVGALGAALPDALRDALAELAASRLADLLRNASLPGLRLDDGDLVVGEDLRLPLLGGLEECRVGIEETVLAATCTLTDLPSVLWDALRT